MMITSELRARGVSEIMDFKSMYHYITMEIMIIPSELIALDVCEMSWTSNPCIIAQSVRL